MRGAFRRNDEGSSTAETALACTVLLAVVFGIFQLSVALFRYHFIAEAARLGTRYGMVHGSSCSGCSASTTDVQNYVLGLKFPGINSSNMSVTATYPTTGAACWPVSSPCNNPGNLVRVKVQYDESLVIPFLPAKAFTVSSTSQMVISN